MAPSRVVSEIFSVQKCDHEIRIRGHSRSLKVVPFDRLPIIVVVIIFYPRYQGSRGVWKKLEENCRSDHYSGQSSNTKESCSSTPLNRCTSTETIIIIIIIIIIDENKLKGYDAHLAQGSQACLIIIIIIIIIIIL